MNIHERIIARLEEFRCVGFQTNLSNRSNLLIDMAIDDVRRKCPNCGDVGSCKHLDPPIDPKRTITVKCYCDRPAYLEECERRLNGASNG